MKNSWESAITLNNALLWGLSVTTGVFAVNLLLWATLWAVLAAETFLSTLVHA